ncbi:MAG: mechanosensitive ion channel domain-containing protein [Armatimonadota bacterium]
MLEYFSIYISRVWGSTLPNRLMWAIAVALIVELLVWLLSKRLRKAFAPLLQRDMILDATERVKRRRVILGLPLLLMRAVLYTVGLLVILRYLGFNPGAELLPLLIALLAVMAVIFWQVLRDAAGGYFIMYDDLYATGDRVTIGQQVGTVTDVGLRYTRLRGADGREIMIGNGTVREVVNHTRALEVEKRAGRV